MRPRIAIRIGMGRFSARRSVSTRSWFRCFSRVKEMGCPWDSRLASSADRGLLGRVSYRLAKLRAIHVTRGSDVIRALAMRSLEAKFGVRFSVERRPTNA